MQTTAPAAMPTTISGQPEQFNIPQHYDMMAELDRDVHDDVALADTETELALRLIGNVPRRLFLPCCGMGRHIGPLRARGVDRIVGVDLSPRCLARAREAAGRDLGRNVQLVQADLSAWRAEKAFDASVCLGNSLGDATNPAAFTAVNATMVQPVKSGGVVLFDYIGEGFLERCAEGRTSEWDAVLGGRGVKDRRTPRFDAATRIMTIDVVVTAADDDSELWRGAYKKRVLPDAELMAHFAALGVRLERMGTATELNRAYYATHDGNLGMIARSTWWRGTKR